MSYVDSRYKCGKDLVLCDFLSWIQMWKRSKITTFGVAVLVITYGVLDVFPRLTQSNTRYSRLRAAKLKFT